jgi:hypothetical protein
MTLPYDPNREFSWDNLCRTFDAFHQEGYEILNCLEYLDRRSQPREEGSRLAVLRVDVDRSPSKALVMARLMAERGIHGTFFYRLHSPDYNLLGFESFRCFKEVQNLGFEIGLHAEPEDGGYVLGEDPATFFRRDVRILESLLGTPFVGCASHRNSSGLNNIDFWAAHRPADFGLRYEAYDPETFGLFQESTYVSESPLDRWKVYRNGELVPDDHQPLIAHVLKQTPILYVLLHPFVFRERHFFER